MELPGSPAKASLSYRPRDAAASPLYRIVLDHLEEYLIRAPTSFALMPRSNARMASSFLSNGHSATLVFILSLHSSNADPMP